MDVVSEPHGEADDLLREPGQAILGAELAKHLLERRDHELQHDRDDSERDDQHGARVDHGRADLPAIIEEEASIAHNCVIHGAVIGRQALIGNGGESNRGGVFRWNGSFVARTPFR